ncbi:hypothetical protein AA0521_1084 [Komagataeibacter intermedius NRIC 0521]|uniref:Uncharacterized protein n=1 Tax=Komagataeibacter intermedius NRIC 0521 TaxID=1307934 RepID=A0ABQ0PGJ0_9PROT|nr:hypothetical protein AA0521_1084 [Komagataeibacter intermedius NRIC 0521]
MSLQMILKQWHLPDTRRSQMQNLRRMPLDTRLGEAGSQKIEGREARSYPALAVVRRQLRGQ